jgi:prophage regulatory protein
MTNERLLRIDEVSSLVGLKRSAIYARVSANTFPKPVPLGQRCNVWPESAVRGWISERIKNYPMPQAA